MLKDRVVKVSETGEAFKINCYRRDLSLKECIGSEKMRMEEKGRLASMVKKRKDVSSFLVILYYG